MARRSRTPALSVRQPWAWAIVAGYKDVENRSWSTQYRGPLLIHAGLKRDPEGMESMRRRGLELVMPELAFGAIIGQVTLVDVVTTSRSSWAVRGLYHFLLEDAEPLARPRPLKGRLGIFQP